MQPEEIHAGETMIALSRGELANLYRILQERGMVNII